MKLGSRRISALGLSLTVHLCAAIVIIWVAPSINPVARTLGARAAVMFVPPGREAAMAGRKPPAAEAIAAIPDDLNIPVETGDAPISIEGFPFDFEKIVRRAALLFPFVTGSTELDPLMAPTPPSGLVRLVDWLAFWRPSMPPLTLDDRDFQSLVDRSWSRRNRWRAFDPIRALAIRHDADQGRLPSLLREYGLQNALQPYGDARVRDPRLWAQLGLAADHGDFIGFISGYTAEHPASKAATELLFVLDRLAQASLDALLTLTGTAPEADLRWTAAADSRAYRAIVTIREFYRIQLERRELSSPRALTAYYDALRVAILHNALRIGPAGYRASDARFLTGEIYWKQGKRPEAVRSWREMTIDPAGAYVTSSTALLDALRDPAGRVDVRRIDGILDSEQGRWMRLSLDRLQQFGYQLDTF